MADFYFQLKDLAVGYHGNPLIRDINIGIDKGEIVTLIGPNGSGKSTILKSITKQLTLIGGKVTIGEKNLKDLSYKELATKMAAAADCGLDEGNSLVTAIYLIDETQMLLYKQQINDQKLVAGLIYLDNYDEALESVEEVRRSLLTALIDRKISKYISSMNGIVKSIEKDKYFFVGNFIPPKITDKSNL